MSRVLIGAVLLVLSFSAFGEQRMEFRHGGDVMTLVQQQCSDERVLKHIPEDYRPAFYKAETLIDGKRYAACWTMAGGYVVMVYEDGDMGRIQMGHFRPVKVHGA